MQTQSALGKPGFEGRALRVFLLVICGGLISLQVASLAAPLVGEHNWRQADTFSVARHMAEGRGNLLYPRIDWYRKGKGVMGMEAPIYGWLSSWPMRLFGPSVPVARVVAWALTAAGFALLLVELVRRSRRAFALALLLAACLSPLVLFESRQVQPDGPVFGLLCAAAALLLRYAREGRGRWFALGLAVFTLAALMKPPALCAGPAMWLFACGAAPWSWRRAVVLGAFFLVPLGAYFGWNAWAEHLNATYNAGEAYFATRIDFKEFRDNALDLGRLKTVFGGLYLHYVSSWLLLPMWLTGLVVGFRREHRALTWAMLSWLCLGALFSWLVLMRLWTHWYYLTVVAPPMLYFAALGVADAWQTLNEPAPNAFARMRFFFVALCFAVAPLLGGSPLRPPGQEPGGILSPDAGWFGSVGGFTMGGLTLLATLLAHLHRKWRTSLLAGGLALVTALGVARAAFDTGHVFVRRARFNEWGSYLRHYPPLRAAIDAHVAPDEPVLTVGGSPFYLFLAGRAGFSDGKGDIERIGWRYYRSRGVRVVVYLPGMDDVPKGLGGRKVLAEAERWRLYCIVKDGCPRRTAAR